MTQNNMTRIGVYGVVKKENKILLVKQERGPYANRYDLPGGRIEFGESIDEALHREFVEEVGMDFGSMLQLTNLSTCFEKFHQIGLIYLVSDLKPSAAKGCLKHEWVDTKALSKEMVSPFVWEITHLKI